MITVAGLLTRKPEALPIASDGFAAGAESLRVSVFDISEGILIAKLDRRELIGGWKGIFATVEAITGQGGLRRHQPAFKKRGRRQRADSTAYPSIVTATDC